MRLVTYASDRGPRAGLVRDDSVIDAWDLLGAEKASLRELFVDGNLFFLASLAESETGEFRKGVARTPLESATLLPPIPDPEKIIGIGLNYGAHAAEAGLEPPESPTFFGKFRNALAAPGAVVKLPASSGKVDFEAEVAFVIGTRAKDVSEADALDHLAGYMLLNDLSARDLQFATPQWMPGKVFDGAAPCGPALVTPDEAGPADAIEIALDLNGERMQEATTADLIFSIPSLVAHLSSLMTLEPGDIVTTGTPAGVGSTRDPRVWLQEGDEIVITSPQLGRLETMIG